MVNHAVGCAPSIPFTTNYSPASRAVLALGQDGTMGPTMKQFWELQAWTPFIWTVLDWARFQPTRTQLRTVDADTLWSVCYEKFQNS